MSADAFGFIEVAGYAFAVVLLIAATVFYFTQHIREVRDEMTGRTSARAIDELRAGRAGARRSSPDVREMGKGSKSSGHASASEASGSLHVRKISAGAPLPSKKTAVPAAPVEPSEAGTTLLGSDSTESGAGARPGSTGAVPASETSTTLLSGEPGLEPSAMGPVESAPSEAGTTLLSDGIEEDVPVSSEAGTPLLELEGC